MAALELGESRVDRGFFLSVGRREVITFVYDLSLEALHVFGQRGDSVLKLLHLFFVVELQLIGSPQLGDFEACILRRFARFESCGSRERGKGCRVKGLGDRLPCCRLQ